MTDKELLELAAKAGGIEYDAEASKPHPKSKAFFGLWMICHGEPYEGQRRYWNPLTDDGDALRLAVALRLVVQHAPNYVVVMFAPIRFSDVGVYPDIACHEDSGDDPCAATRRAITRAAAELGRAAP